MNMAAESSRKMKKYPDFFKVYMPQLNSEYTKIPNSFLRHLDKKLPKEIILRCGERSRKVRVVQFGPDTFFKKGWKEFIQENGVKAAYFLVFHYDGGCAFDVRVYGRSGMLKKPVAVNSELIEVEEEEEKEEEMKEEKEEEEAEESDHIVAPAGEKEDDRTNEGDNGKSIADEGEEETERDGFLWARKHLTDQDNPFFVRKLGSRSEYVLVRVLVMQRVPSEVVRACNLEFPEEVTFMNKRGREWDGNKVNRWRDGRICIAGWKNFCKWNFVRENDECICEVLLGREKFTIKVHIVSD